MSVEALQGRVVRLASELSRPGRHEGPDPDRTPGIRPFSDVEDT